MLTRILKRQRGFTLIELLAVTAILIVLAGIVAGAVGGIGATGQTARLQADADTLGKAADRFFNDAFPQSYPVVSLANTPTDIKPISLPGESNASTVDFGIRLLDFEAVLPGDPKRAFVPDFLKEVPNTAAQVSWRVDTATGKVFFTEDGAVLARPSGSKFSVQADSSLADDGVGTPTGIQYTFTQQWKKGGAAQVELQVEIPAGYVIGGQSLAADVRVGTFTTQFYTDNPWEPGQVINYAGTVNATGLSNEWEARINLGERTNRVYKISIVAASADQPGKMTIVTDRVGDVGTNSEVLLDDTDFEESSGTWVLTIFATEGSANDSTGTPLIINPTTKDVYRWPAKEHTATDVEGFFSPVPGNTAVIIKAALTLTSIAVTPATSSVAIAATLQFTATGTFSDGTTQVLTSSATWTSSNTAKATIASTTGLATGVAAGTTTITATLGSVSGNTTLTVPEPTP